MTVAEHTSPDIQHSELYSAVPNAARARTLRISVGELLKKNLHRAISNAAKILPAQGNAALAIVEALDTTRRISATVFVYHWQLSSAIRQQDIGLAATTLSRIVTAAEQKRLYADNLRISSLQWDEIDAATVDYLCRPEGPRGPGGELPEMRALAEFDFDQLVVSARDAMGLLAIAHPEMYGEFHELASGIRLYEPRFVGSMSSPRSFGVMYIYKPHTEDSLADPTLFYLNHMTHETSHIALNAVVTQSPLILNNPEERYPSTVRPDLRPMDGVYHAAFVLSRVALVQSQPVVIQRPGAVQTQKDTLKAFWGAYETVATHGKLTTEGQAIIDSCREIIEGLPSLT